MYFHRQPSSLLAKVHAKSPLFFIAPPSAEWRCLLLAMPPHSALGYCIYMLNSFLSCQGPNTPSHIALQQRMSLRIRLTTYQTTCLLRHMSLVNHICFGIGCRASLQRNTLILDRTFNCQMADHSPSASTSERPNLFSGHAVTFSYL